ncbi:ABC transporter ATP-binding protein [Corynebacterium sp. ES2775-CONJ]|uniref:dipeptide ABC transporter ATP-binding protein n=1 Tax=Corynebacterium sp. ES2775-CONJ TaxID=2974029 RepID=UPI0021675017|nr:ABC transporter ATP-binding protein [Corynebacterium sp. ES2775-CONJ]MCS4490552.1 ABC transporter ATP-binding protein [Corynebacterium sp. ES2775-CONJ]
MLKVEELRTHGVIDAISFEIGRGERVGLIGESGSGKTLTALSIMRLIDSTGAISLDGTRLDQLSEQALCGLRGKKVAMIFQEPMTALNPLMTIRAQVSEAVRIHKKVSRTNADRKAAALLAKVELDSELLGRYPHELSGGQRQRVLIAMALAHDPELLICDEPTTALDVTSQRAIIELIMKLVRERGTSLLFITHDLGLVASTCERILVMHKGTIVETGTTDQVLRQPQHPYTQMLVSASILPQARKPQVSDEIVADMRGVSKRFGRHSLAVDDIDFTVYRGQRLGIVGGSGSGKTTTLKLLAGLEKPTSGALSTTGCIQMVFQDPMGSLNPRMKIRDIISETLPRRDDARIREVLHEVGLDPEMMDRYPHEFSGGQRQRLSLARALAPRPDILLADEPVSALDVSVRKKVLELLDSLVDQLGLTLIFVSHDIHVVRSVCTDVLVMNKGHIVESGPVSDVLSTPQSAYTQALIDAVPDLIRHA